MSNYEYAANKYNTLDEVKAAVTDMKDKLDNKPTTWCVVKPMINPKTITLSIGDTVVRDSGTPLNDAQIKALSSSDNVYNIYSINEGDNFIAVAEDVTVTKVNVIKLAYARMLQVNKYFDYETKALMNVTNEDMSGYV
tara:strand:- start:109 stop:522 length:414 start_codon:yes stop_codon:yes gene_type:complete